MLNTLDKKKKHLDEPTNKGENVPIPITLGGNLIEYILSTKNTNEYIKMCFNIPPSEYSDEDLPTMFHTLITILGLFDCKKTRVHFSMEKGIVLEDILQNDKHIYHEEHLSGRVLKQIIKKLNVNITVTSLEWKGGKIFIDDTLQILDVEDYTTNEATD
jgi:hypothetical protein